MSVFLIVLGAAVALLLAARAVRNYKQRGLQGAKSATRSSKSSGRFSLKPLSTDELELKSDSDNADALTAKASLSTERTAATPAHSPLVVIHAMADKNKPYHGYDLLQSLLENNLRFGEHSIFHCYSGADMKQALFSVTSLNKPGTFDLPKMGSFSCDGLIFFAELDRVEQPEQVLQMMLDVSEKIVASLGGYLGDDKRTLLSTEVVQHMREQAVSYGSYRAASAA